MHVSSKSTTTISPYNSTIQLIVILLMSYYPMLFSTSNIFISIYLRNINCDSFVIVMFFFMVFLVFLFMFSTCFVFVIVQLISLLFLSPLIVATPRRSSFGCSFCAADLSLELISVLSTQLSRMGKVLASTEVILSR